MNRRTILAGLIGCLCFGVGLHTAAGGPVLIGGSPDGIIYDVDPATGLASNPRDVGIGEINGLAWSPSGVLYARTGFFSDTPNSLFTVEVGTGAADFVGSIGISGWDFGFDPATSLLLGKSLQAGGFGTSLYTIDPQTAGVDLLATIGVGGGSAVVDPAGSLYVFSDDAIGSDVLTLLDKTSGDTLQVWLIGAQLGRPGLAFAPDGTLFIADGSVNGTGNLYLFDISTATLTNVGSTGLDGGLTSLAVIPEPSTLVLLTLGMVGLFAKGRRVGRARGDVFAG